MARTLLLGVEAPLPVETGTATSFTQASAVRLVNTGVTTALINVVDAPNGNDIGSMSLPAGAVETLEKQYSHCIFSNSDLVLGAKVGFTG